MVQKIPAVIGEINNSLLCIGVAHDQKKGSLGIYKCVCGTIIKKLASAVRVGSVKDCGCGYRDRTSIIGRKVGMMMVIKSLGKFGDQYNHYLAYCDCGTFFSFYKNIKPHRRSCGCVRTSDVSDGIYNESQLHFSGPLEYLNDFPDWMVTKKIKKIGLSRKIIKFDTKEELLAADI